MLSVENLLQAFWYIAMFASVLYALKAITYFVAGGGAEVFSDFNSIIDTDSSFGFISVESILAFLMGFGWTGWLMLKHPYQVWLTLLVAFGAGLLFMFFQAYVLYLIKKLEHNVVVDYSTCVGKIAKTYTKFEPKASGQIQIEVNSRLSIVNAMNNSEEFIESFADIKVVKFENEVLYIEKV